MVKLTAKQMLFVKEYLVDLNATQAAIRAGYSEKTAGQIGEQNLKKLEIAAAIQEEMNKRAQRTEITQDKVLQELAKLGFYDPRNFFKDDGTAKEITELDDTTAAAICSIEVFEEYDGQGENKTFVGYTKKYKLADKRAALVDIGKHIGMFIERKEVGNPGDFDKLNDDELERSLKQAAEFIDRARVESKVLASVKGKTKAT